MKPTQLTIFLILFILAISGCVPSNLEKKINSRSYYPILVHKTKAINQKKSATLFVQYIDESKMPIASVVERKNWFFIDLLIMYYYKYKMKVSLGNLSCNPKAFEFYSSSTTEILKRAGIFTLVSDTTNKPQYRAVITIKKMDIFCEYISSGLAIGSSSSRKESSGPAQGIVATNLKVYNDANQLVLEKDYQNIETISQLSSSSKIKEVKFNSMKNLTEKLSISVESIGALITEDLNNLFTP